MIKKTLIKSLLGLSYAVPLIAGTMGDIKPSPALPTFYVGAFGGYGAVDGGYQHDGNVAQGRLTLGVHAKDFNHVLLGAELGVQSGNTMRLNASDATIEIGGGLPVQSTLKPFVDALITLNYQFQPDRPLFAILKGGIAFRQLQLEDRSSNQDSLSQVNGEFQGGLGYNITDQVKLTATYQGIYNTSNAGVSLNSLGDTTISHIPTQQAGLLGVEYSF